MLLLKAILLSVVAATNLLSDPSVLRADDVLYKPYSALLASDIDINADADLTRRQSTTENSTWSSEVQFTADGKIDFSVWNNATNAACISRLRIVGRSSNPSGNSICYNLPMLDTKAGTFEADLRLYRVSDPRGSFAGVSPGDIQVGVVYTGASVSPMKDQPDTGLNNTSVNITKRADGEISEGPTLLQAYMLVGQIDKDKMKDNMSMADLEILIMPILTLTARTPSGGEVSTNVSLNEASFLLGAFSKDIILSDWAAAQLAVDDQLAALHNGTISFIMPGTQIMIFPVGLIITTIWLALGVAAFGYGTYERIQYRDLHRRAVVRAGGI
ncbi:hypothetical protein PT974_02191 [Cladobotryum mycophilum]|uniref:Uncharacterized protein n=1 Tax=Cladobotryum mycophilum TaxID=491253 RepID=A0ABR0SYQ0_9HYPO